MNKCPFCNSDAIIAFGRGNGFNRNYEKEEDNGTPMFHNIVHKTWSMYFQMSKYLCTQCGMVHEKLSEDNLKYLKENEQYEAKR